VLREGVPKIQKSASILRIYRRQTVDEPHEVPRSGERSYKSEVTLL
jgi:hypothetical protein